MKRQVSSSGPQHLPEPRHPPLHRQHSMRGHSDTGSHPRTAADPYPRPLSSPDVDVHTNGKPVRAQSRKHRVHAPHAPLFVHEPYQCPPAPTQSVCSGPKYTPSSQDTPQRSMLERKQFQSRFVFNPAARLKLPGPAEAWHVSMTTDPLMDSDDETYADENTRLDYGSFCLVRV